MPRNGSGTYSRTNGANSGATTWTLDRNAGAKITASRHDAHDQDMADAITASLAKNGETTPTANLPMGTFHHTGVGAATARTDYGRVAEIQDCSYSFDATDTGAADAYAIQVTPAIAAYAAGQLFRFIAANANTGASTLAVSGLATKAIKRNDGSTALASGDIAAGSLVVVQYDGTNFRLLTTPLGSATAAAARTQLAAAASGSNSDITALTGLASAAWNPTINPIGQAPVATSLTVGRAVQIGALRAVNLNVGFTTAGSAYSSYIISAPAAPAADEYVLTGFVAIGTSLYSMEATYAAAQSGFVCKIGNPTVAVWPASTAVTVFLDGVYMTA